MSDLSSLDKFQVFAPISSDDSVLTATANSNAVEGEYDIVVTQLAESQKLASNPFADPEVEIGEGTLSLSVAGNSFDVTIDSTNSSLFGIRDAINDAADNTGITATVINEDNGSRLILTADDSGTANTISVSATNAGSGDLSQLDGAALTETRAAADAILTVDTFAVTSSSNTVNDAVQGVTFNLTGIGSSNLAVARDDEAVTASVQAFADAFNALRDEIDNQRSGHLEAEGTLLSLESQLLNVLNNGTPITGSSYSYLSEVGISVDKNGRMQVESSIIQSVLDTDFRSFANLLAADGEGYAFRLKDLADELLQDDGLIDAREDGLNGQIDRMDDQKLRIEYRLDLREQRIRAQFTALDTLVANLNVTSSFLSQQLTSLAGNFSNNN